MLPQKQHNTRGWFGGGGAKADVVKSFSGVAIMGRPYPRQFKLSVFAFQAFDLEARDDSGLSDPYLVVRYCGQSIQTKVVKNNVNPQWLSVHHMKYDKKNAYH